MAYGWYLEGLCGCQICVGTSAALFRKASLHQDLWDWRTVPLKWGGQQVWEIPNSVTFFVLLSSGHLWGLLCSTLGVSVFRRVEISLTHCKCHFFPSSFSLDTCAFWMFLLMATSPYFMEALLFSSLKNKKMHLFDTDSLSVQSHSFSVLASIFCWRFPTVSSCPLFGMPVPLKPPQEFPLHFLVTDAATEERVSVLLMRVSSSAVVARSLFLALARESFLGHLSPIA